MTPEPNCNKTATLSRVDFRFCNRKEMLVCFLRGIEMSSECRKYTIPKVSMSSMCCLCTPLERRFLGYGPRLSSSSRHARTSRCTPPAPMLQGDAWQLANGQCPDLMERSVYSTLVRLRAHYTSMHLDGKEVTLRFGPHGCTAQTFEMLVQFDLYLDGNAFSPDTDARWY